MKMYAIKFRIGKRHHEQVVEAASLGRAIYKAGMLSQRMLAKAGNLATAELLRVEEISNN